MIGVLYREATLLVKNVIEVKRWRWTTVECCVWQIATL